ncbi:MAG: cation diffusion facilitator family transporter [Aquiluna sp.]|nr:cation diffusion facilitator family transporter [Aquiluna sp.]MCF8545836.1 cation diffusion facilitator family transporter [Aquiluna sp.]
MSHEGSTKAILAALFANLGIAITKFVAYLFSGAASMLAESVHSLADSANQLLLILGGKRAKRAATEEHPFGYGRSRYVYAFIVSVVLFTVGGMFSLYEGIDKLNHPHELENVWLPITVLLIAIVLEGFSLRTAIRESRPFKGNQTWLQFIRRAKSPELPVVLLEDTAAQLGLVMALVGVGLSVITGNPIWDAFGTIAIGALLMLVAVLLGVEMASLLIGEGGTAGEVASIKKALISAPGVESVIHLKTLYLGPEELMLAAKIAIKANATGEEIAQSIDSAELAVREAVPATRVIYLEPDIQRVSVSR